MGKDRRVHYRIKRKETKSNMQATDLSISMLKVSFFKKNHKCELNVSWKGLIFKLPKLGTVLMRYFLLKLSTFEINRRKAGQQRSTMWKTLVWPSPKCHARTIFLRSKKFSRPIWPFSQNFSISQSISILVLEIENWCMSCYSEFGGISTIFTAIPLRDS